MLSTCNAICAVSPVIGGALALGTGGYVRVFLTLFIIAMLLLLSVGFTLPEAARNIVGNGLTQPHGIWRTWSSFFYRSQKQKTNELKRHQSPKLDKGKISWRPIDAFASLRIVLYSDATAVLLMVATSYSIYYTFQAAIPVIFDEVYGYNELEIGLALLPVLVGLTAGGILAENSWTGTIRKQHGNGTPLLAL
jgi:hypothetical protein